MSGSCPVSAHVCRETARERDELRAEVERLKSDVNRYRGSAALYQRLMQEAVSERDEARAEVERLRAGIEAIRDEAWVPWLNKDWQHLDTVRNDCNALLDPTEGDRDE